MDVLLHDLAKSVSGARTLEDVTRTLLGVLETVTGLDSTYLTRIDFANRNQSVLFAHNVDAQRMNIPEGLTLAWEDTVCRRALEEGVTHTQAADDRWGDLQAVQDLGIRTYLGQPVWDIDGSLVGTLCGVSDRRVPLGEDTLHVVHLFAQLIAHQFGRERMLADLQPANEELSADVVTDALTGIANRRALVRELDRCLGQAQRDGSRVGVAFIDLDDFKALNDRFGRATGDHFLINMAGRLTAVTRVGEFIARHGGDEFAVVSRLESAGAEADLAERLAKATRGRFRMGAAELDYPGASVGTAVSEPDDDATTLLHRAEAAMVVARGQKDAARARPAADDGAPTP